MMCMHCLVMVKAKNLSSRIGLGFSSMYLENSNFSLKFCFVGTKNGVKTPHSLFTSSVNNTKTFGRGRRSNGARDLQI